MGAFDDLPTINKPKINPTKRSDTPTGGAFDDLPAVGESPPPRVLTETEELKKAGLIPDYLSIPVNSVENALRSARQGLSLGFSDELAGAGSAAKALVTGGSPAEAYRQARDLERARLHQFEKDSPAASVLGNIGGGLMTAMVPAGAVAKVPTFIGRVARSIPVGAATGAVAGLGAGEGDVQQQAKSAGRGALLGAAVAPVITTAGAALGKAAPVVGNIYSRITGGAARSGNISAAAQGATTAPPQGRALNIVGNTMRRAGVTPEAIEEQLVRNEELAPKPEMLADFLGERGARQLYSSRTLGGPATSEAIERVATRGEGTSARVSEDVQQATAQRGQSLEKLAARIEGRRQIGNMLYREAYRHGNVTNPDTLEMIQNPRVSEILKKASDRRAKVADLRGETYQPLFRETENGPALARMPTVEDLHLLKTSLDDDIRQAYQAGEGQLGTALRDFKNRIVQNLENEVPAYKKARETYKGDIEIEEAIENGRADILRKPVDELYQDFNKLSGAEQDAYRSGAIDTILARKVDPKVDSADFARSLWGNADSRNRLRLLVKSEDELVKLARQFEREQRMTRTNRSVLGGSPTAMREVDIAESAAGAMADVATQGPQGAFVSMVGRWIRRAGGLTEPVADDVAKLLTAETPETIRAVLQSLKGAERQRVMQAMAQQQAAQGAVASSAQQGNQ